MHELTTAYEAGLAAFENALQTTAEHDYIRRGRLYGKVADVWVAMNRHERGHEFYTLAESVLSQAPQRIVAWWSEWLRIKLQRMDTVLLGEPSRRHGRAGGSDISQCSSSMGR